MEALFEKRGVSVALRDRPYGANGELQGRTLGAETTSYNYDVFGNLLNATLPSGTAVAYVVDGQNRRVGTQVNGATTEGLLYQDQLNVIAQLTGSGTVASRFVFGSKANVPDYYATSAGTLRILSDHLGSPRLIVNTANGSVVESIAYDEFGNVMNDTAPGTIPFGFAGGLRDLDTGLVRFGARDYDPSVGRWTSKDPTRLKGGMNLYGYSMNDPVDFRDPKGTDVYNCLTTFAGVLPHWYQCVVHYSTGPADPGYTYCYGHGQTSEDTFNPNNCTLVPGTENNDCVDNCLSQAFTNAPPNYNFFTNNCYSYGHNALDACLANCGEWP